MEKSYTSYPVSFSNKQVSRVIGLMEEAIRGIDQDLVLTAALVMALGISDPDIFKDDIRFANALDSVSKHIVWVLSNGLDQPINPKDFN